MPSARSVFLAHCWGWGGAEPSHTCISILLTSAEALRKTLFGSRAMATVLGSALSMLLAMLAKSVS